jgi:predicted TIM-barrel fold metal-dependent hydrolase
MKNKTFYDIHVHAFNLSHPNLSVFLSRRDWLDKAIDASRILKIILWFAVVVVLFPIIFIGFLLYIFYVFIFAHQKQTIKKNIQSLIGKYLNAIINKITRTLSFYEIPLEYQFLVLDYFLKSREPKFSKEGSPIVIGSECYDKIVLCPLVIDFGRKSISEGIFYNSTPKRPIANQVGDLLYAIRTYYRFNVFVEKGNMRLSEELDLEEGKREKVFEIYPFMGIDPENYDSWEEIEKLLDKYFYEFEKDESAETRRKRLFEKMGKVNSNMYNNTEGHYYNVFAGIKVYPQLGFDPYPTDLEKRKKVEELYKYCIHRRIPIISHCSDGGYKPEDNDSLTSPLGKWKQVLEAKNEKLEALFAELTLCFAHFGSQSSQKTEWRDAIIELTKKYLNVYTDISCNAMTPTYYKELEKLFNKKNSQLHERVMFGSDFSINMLATDCESYNQFLKAFADANISHKRDLCENNPERFLFGKD